MSLANDDGLTSPQSQPDQTNQLPDVNYIALTLRDVYCRTAMAHDLHALVRLFNRVDFQDYHGDEWEDQPPMERAENLIPRNLGLWLPSDPVTEEEPHNIRRWIYSNRLGMSWNPALVFFTQLEVELIIDEAKSIKGKREQGLHITKEIRSLLIVAIRHFTSRKELRAALDHINEWRDYFIDTAGCYSNGLLDRQAAAINNFNREVTA
jgi:hypothetical protein